MSESTQDEVSQASHDAQSSATPSSVEQDTLLAALVQIEQHVSAAGWDQPVRLFALVRTDELIRAEPALAEHLAVGSPDGLSSIEQEDFHGGDDLASALARMAWPPTVAGCAVALERFLLPPQHEADLPDDPAEAERLVAQHPNRVAVRAVIGALRDGTRTGVGRLVSNPDDLLGGNDLMPGLSKALWETLR